MPLTKEQYKNEKDWDEKYPDKNVLLDTSKVRSGWKPLFDKLKKDKRFATINSHLKAEMDEAEGELLMYPKPDYVFRAFELIDFDEVKVVIIGQDPYFNNEVLDDVKVPQATGLSFSVPVGFSVPSSLKNIYNNLLKHGHILEKPDHGDLEFWAFQGCLMLNTSLTVLDGQENKNCHSPLWKWFTDEVIKYISEKSKYCVFVLWGADAFKKSTLIDLDIHDAVISSHPSGLSADKAMKDYPAFNNIDHFGMVNSYLRKKKLKQIIWQN